jgi:DNA-binding HxlR family transcriptional regulator
MQRKSFGQMVCPIARSLEHVGEWWSILILRDALHGVTRFDHFQKSLGIAPNMLARRLNALVSAGLLERRRYSAHPPRDDYVPTASARDFRPILIALLAWGNKYFAPEGPSVLLVNTKTGAAVDPVLVDPATGRPITSPEYAFAAGPAAGERTRRRYSARLRPPGAKTRGSMRPCPKASGRLPQGDKTSGRTHRIKPGFARDLLSEDQVEALTRPWTDEELVVLKGKTG